MTSPAEESAPRREIIAKDWCKTMFPCEEASILWTVENIVYCVQNIEEPLHSSTFHAGSEKSTWRLKVYPKGSQDCHDHVALYVQLENSISEETITAEFVFYILDKKDEKINKVSGTNAFSKGGSWGFRKFLLKESLIDKEDNTILSNGSLRICCQIIVMYDPKVTSGQTAIFLRKPPKCDLAQSYAWFFNNAVFSDVTLRMKGQEIFAHKLILSLHSPVFSAMFNHEMKENIQNLVEITDIPYETMEDVIRFIYTGNVPNLETSARDLLQAAEKYQLEQLKATCEEELALTLSVETAVDIFLRANRHGAKNLRICAVDFIGNNLDSVRKTKEWKEAISEEPHLMEAVYFASRHGIDNIISLCDRMDIKPNECVKE